jgi:hypothetical protein
VGRSISRSDAKSGDSTTSSRRAAIQSGARAGLEPASRQRGDLAFVECLHRENVGRRFATMKANVFLQRHRSSGAMSHPISADLIVPIDRPEQMVSGYPASAVHASIAFLTRLGIGIDRTGQVSPQGIRCTAWGSIWASTGHFAFGTHSSAGESSRFCDNAEKHHSCGSRLFTCGSLLLPRVPYVVHLACGSKAGNGTSSRTRIASDGG